MKKRNEATKNVCVVGGFEDDRKALHDDGLRDDYVGATWIFAESGGTFTQIQKLVTSDYIGVYGPLLCLWIFADYT